MKLPETPRSHAAVGFQGSLGEKLKNAENAGGRWCQSVKLWIYKFYKAPRGWPSNSCSGSGDVTSIERAKLSLAAVAVEWYGSESVWTSWRISRSRVSRSCWFLFPTYWIFELILGNLRVICQYHGPFMGPFVRAKVPSYQPSVYAMVVPHIQPPPPAAEHAPRSLAKRWVWKGKNIAVGKQMQIIIHYIDNSSSWTRLSQLYMQGRCKTSFLTQHVSSSTSNTARLYYTYFLNRVLMLCVSSAPMFTKQLVELCIEIHIIYTNLASRVLGVFLAILRAVVCWMTESRCGTGRGSALAQFLISVKLDQNRVISMWFNSCKSVKSMSHDNPCLTFWSAGRAWWKWWHHVGRLRPGGLIYCLGHVPSCITFRHGC